MSRTHRFTPAPLLLSLLCLILVSCQSPSDSARPAAFAVPLPNAADSTTDHDIDALAAALPDAFTQMHWGQLKITNEITALSAIAVTEDDRTVHIQAQLDPNRHAALQIRVGLTGDPALEKTFLIALRDAIQNQRKKQSHP